MSERIRGFLAFDINDKLVLQRFTEVQRLLLETGADLKLVAPKNIHITLHFLGDISSNMVEQILDSMKKVSFSAFDCSFHGLGVFPNFHRVSVIWAGIEKGAHELENVFEQLKIDLRGSGFRVDQKSFSPHLTLARVRSGRNKAELIRCIQELADYNFGVVRTDCLRLKKSVLTPEGPLYSTLREVCH
jgi:2'-5' RNA ligase